MADDQYTITIQPPEGERINIVIRSEVRPWNTTEARLLGELIWMELVSMALEETGEKPRPEMFPPMKPIPDLYPLG